MIDRNYVLLVAAYDDESSAATDFTAIDADEELSVVAAVVLSRKADGSVEAKKHGGRLIGTGTAVGAVSGLVIGLFAPPLLLSGAVGAGIGAGVAAISKHVDEKKLGVDAQEWLPVGGSAIVAVVDDLYFDRVDAAFEQATRTLRKAIDEGDYEAAVKAVNEGDEKIIDAIDS